LTWTWLASKPLSPLLIDAGGLPEGEAEGEEGCAGEGFQAVTLDYLQNPLIHCDGLQSVQAVRKLGKQ